jgi:LmbE family N-acetylglucosaminyl deacetylase
VLSLTLPALPDRPLRVLCLGAHCDDIEIGCGATLMRLALERPVEVDCVTFCAPPERAAESRAALTQMLQAAQACRLRFESLPDGYLPAHWAEAKRLMESLKSLPVPDLVLTHERDDLHQDHRVVSELTWNTFRDHLILEYEVPKYDGGLRQPQVYLPIPQATAQRKAQLLVACHASQRPKHWFSADAFLALMRLRGLECRAPEGYAEAFHARKLTL